MTPAQHTLSHAPGGGFYDPLNPMARAIDFAHVAQCLAGIVRFNGARGALPVAQHVVLGAEAIIAEGGSSFEAALFLHHDDHEFILGDQTRPVDAALAATVPGYREGWALLKANWDRALYGALSLPAPDAWTKQQHALISSMDTRMSVVEARSLFGPRAVAHHAAEARRTPRFNSALCPPWPSGLAEERYLAMHRKLTGRTLR